MPRVLFNKDIFYPHIIEMMTIAPPSEIDETLRKRIVEFLKETDGKATDAQVYDFLDSTAEAAFYGEASKFVMTLCDVRAYYIPPVDSKFYGTKDWR